MGTIFLIGFISSFLGASAFLAEEVQSLTQEKDSEVFAAFSEVLHQGLTRDYKTILFLSEEVTLYATAQSLLFLPWPREVLPSSEVDHHVGLLLLFPDSRNVSYQFLLDSSSRYHERKYIIFTENVNRIYEDFDIFWKFRVVDTIAMLRTASGTFIIYTFFPFKSHDCSNSNPVMTAVKKRGEPNFSPQMDFFSVVPKMYDLRGCQLKIAVKDTAVRASKNASETHLRGVTRKILSFMERRMNFRPVLKYVEEDLDAYVASYFNFTPPTVSNVIKEKVDLGVGRFTQILDWNPDVVFPRQTSSDCFTWAMPVSSLPSRDPMWVYTHLFDVYTWAGVLATYAAVVIVDRMAGKACSASSLEMYGAAIGIGIRCRAKAFFHRFLLGYWCACAFVISSVYQAAMGSFVTVPPEAVTVKTVSDLLHSHLKLYGDPKVFTVLNASNDGSRESLEVLDRFKTLSPSDITKEVDKIVSKGNIAVLDSRYKLINEEHSLMRRTGSGRVIYFLQDCVVNSATTPLIIKRGSILERPIKSLLIRLFESGLIDYWERQELSHSYRPDNGSKFNNNLTLIKRQSALYTLGFGLCLSTLVFIGEILTNLRKRIIIIDTPI